MWLMRGGDVTQMEAGAAGNSISPYANSSLIGPVSVREFITIRRRIILVRRVFIFYPQEIFT